MTHEELNHSPMRDAFAPMQTAIRAMRKAGIGDLRGRTSYTTRIGRSDEDDPERALFIEYLQWKRAGCPIESL